MTSNPHPEHGPLWVERNSRRYGILLVLAIGFAWSAFRD